ncbi:MAG: hypothetical protein U1C46_06580 [Bacteroidales bacterium]|nr:hypothetical protein [Bacteroidales bacterium]
MDSPEVKAYIRKHSNLFWYIPDEKKEGISEDVLVEFILNYGDMNAIRDLFGLIGIKKVAEIFFRSINVSQRRRGNYNELTINYFTLLFNRYAH